VFSVCLAAVKCRPVLHHCVVILFRSSGIMCIVYIWKKSSAHALGALMMWHDKQLQLHVNVAAFSSCRLCVPFINLIQIRLYVKC